MIAVTEYSKEFKWGPFNIKISQFVYDNSTVYKSNYNLAEIRYKYDPVWTYKDTRDYGSHEFKEFADIAFTKYMEMRYSLMCSHQ